jgi:hypothetical protein
LVVAFAVALTAAPGGTAVPAAADDGVRTTDPRAGALLERAVQVSQEVPHSGQLLVASFGEGGPQVTEVRLTRGVDGGMSVADQDGREFGRIDGAGFLRSAGTLLRLGGIERLSVDLDRLHRKYACRSSEPPSSRPAPRPPSSCVSATPRSGGRSCTSTTTPG